MSFRKKALSIIFSALAAIGTALPPSPAEAFSAASSSAVSTTVLTTGDNRLRGGERPDYSAFHGNVSTMTAIYMDQCIAERKLEPPENGKVSETLRKELLTCADAKRTDENIDFLIILGIMFGVPSALLGVSKTREAIRDHREKKAAQRQDRPRL